MSQEDLALEEARAKARDQMARFRAKRREMSKLEQAATRIEKGYDPYTPQERAEMEALREAGESLVARSAALQAKILARLGSSPDPRDALLLTRVSDLPPTRLLLKPV